MDINTLREMHDFCVKQELCENCPFWKENYEEGCPFCSHPFHWELEVIEEVFKNGIK